MIKSLPLWCVCLTIVMLPWYVVRYKLFGIPVTLLECFLIATIVVWSAQQVIALFSTGFKPYFSTLGQALVQHKLASFSIVILLVASTISVFAGNDLASALGIYKAYFIEALLVFVVLITNIRQKSDWLLVLASLLITVIQISTIAITQQLFGWPNFTPAELMQGRSSAMFNTANAIGLFVSPIILFSTALAYGWLNTKRKYSALLLSVIFMGLVAIWFSRSDGALLATSVSMLGGVVALLSIRMRLLRIRMWTVLAVVGVLVYICGTVSFIAFLNHPPEVANPYTRPGFNTFTVRQCTWQGTAQLLSERPVLGSGLAGFTDSYLQHATCDAEPLVYPHNFVLNFWAETGLLGILAISLVVVGWLILCGQLILSGMGLQRWVGIGSFMAIIYWLIHGLVDVPYFKNDLSVLWWLLLALSITARRAWSINKD